MNARIPVLRTSPKVWQLLGPALYTESPLVAVTVRELFQNARDACLHSGRTPEIVLEVQADTALRYGALACDDNGVGMDEACLLDRFLVLGESKKDDGSTGGFGIAKAAILGAASWWEVQTNDLWLSFDHLEEGRPIGHVAGRTGARVSLRYDPPAAEQPPRQPSCRNPRLDPYKLVKALTWLAHSDTPCQVRVNLTGLPPQGWQFPGLNLAGRKPICQGTNGPTTWAGYMIDPLAISPLKWQWGGQGTEVVSATPTGGWVFYRCNGLVQFSELLTEDHPYTFVVEITTSVQPGAPGYPFTPSRESLAGELRDQLKSLLDSHRLNPLTSADRHRNQAKPKDRVYYDGRWMGQAQAERTARDRHEQAQQVADKVGTALRHSALMEEAGPASRIQTSPLGIKILIKGLHLSRRNLLLPHYLRLLEAWGRVVELVMEAYQVREQFGIGFVFDADEIAERYADQEGIFYLLNPDGLTVTRTEETLLTLLYEACHEVAHKDAPNHTESFTARQGSLFRTALRCFAARRRELGRLLAGGQRQPEPAAQPVLL